MTNEISATPDAERFAGLLKQQAERRLESAVEENVLSQHDGIRLTTCVEATGQRFVKREISKKSGVTDNNTRIGFKGDLIDAWEIFTKNLENGPISIVPSSVICNTSGDLTIVSEYREPVTGLQVASLETKVAVAKQLISFASLDFTYRFGLDCIVPSMFNVHLDPNFDETVEVIDVDPYLGSNYMPEDSPISGSPNTTSRGAYIGRIMDTFLNNWCVGDDEIGKVFRAIKGEIGKLLPASDCMMDNRVFQQLNAAQNISHGFYTRR